MNLPFDLPEPLSHLSLMEVAIIVLLVVTVIYVRRAGILLFRLGTENRQLRQGIRGYEHMEVQHREISRENRERNEFHGQIPILISSLHEEKTVSGIAQQIVDFAGRFLGASEVSLFLRDGSTLILRAARGLPLRELRVPLGQGRVGAVAAFRRIMGPEDFDNLDAASRERVRRNPARLDTAVAAPLLAHGEVLGVLNVGGTLGSPPALRKEILSVVAHLGATTLENQLNFERLEREATTDGLTGLSNVRNFKEKLRQELSRSARFGRPCSIFLFDIDNFKHYNDRNGHPAGDECLRLAAAVVRDNVRVTDLPARYGGEEFIVLLPETEAAGALAFAEKIRTMIASSPFPHRENQPLGMVSISGGVATFPTQGSDADALVAAADQALYRCKQEGRNRVAAAAEPTPLRSVAAKV